LVDSTLWILVASVLAAFDVHKKIDVHGKEIPVKGVYKDGLISCASLFFFSFVYADIWDRHPAPFEYEISPRHGEAARLVEGTG
jgi:hypothetical protein